MKIGSDIVAWGEEWNESGRSVREWFLVQNGKARWLLPGPWRDRRAYERMSERQQMPKHLRKPIDVLREAMVVEEQMPTGA